MYDIVTESPSGQTSFVPKFACMTFLGLNLHTKFLLSKSLANQKLCMKKLANKTQYMQNFRLRASYDTEKNVRQLGRIWFVAIDLERSCRVLGRAPTLPTLKRRILDSRGGR